MIVGRRVLHDWGDENCRIILSHLADAMIPESRVLITEQLMSDPPIDLTAWSDLLMFNIGGKERTVENWRKLTSAAGLQAVKFWTTPGSVVGVIECVKA